MVTIIIVNWNSGELLAQCIEHLLAQTARPEKIIVVDNNSVDDSARRVLQIPEVSLRMLSENLGFAAANNLALKECTTEFVALLNPDAFPEPDWLETLLEAAKKNQEFSAFGSRQMVEYSRDLIDGLGDAYHISGIVWRLGYQQPLAPLSLKPQEIFAPCAAAALYRRDALIEINGFDEDFFCYVEDVDLGFRLRLAGHRAMLIPDAVVHHIGSATTGGQHSEFSVYHGHRNVVWTYVKNMPGWLFYAFMPLHLLMNFVVVATFTLRGQGRNILCAKRDALLGLPKMWKKRQLIQRARKVSLQVLVSYMEKGWK